MRNALYLLAVLMFPGLLIAQPPVFVFPPDSGVVDLSKPPYNATGNDQTDDTAAIQKALDTHTNQNAVLYLPDGTYYISDTLKWGTGGGGREQKRTTIQGQSRDKTILRLKDAAPGFTDAAKPKSMIWTGAKPAQRFRNGLRTLTVHAGSRNPGAIGVQYIANNQGSVRQITITSGDGGGAIGLDLGYTDEQGPCLIQDVSVNGFDVGISARTIVNSITMDRVQITDPKTVGVRNGGQVISINELTYRGKATAIINSDINGLVTLINSQLTGQGASGPAMQNGGAAFLRDVQITGFSVGVENTAKQGTQKNAPAGKIAEWASHAPFKAFDESRSTSLRLPIKPTPPTPQPAIEKWAGPHQFGANLDDDLDDTEAAQKAVDSGAEVLYFPRGSKGVKIDGELLIRGNIARVTALEGRIFGGGRIKVVDGTAPAVVIDRLDLIYQKTSIEHASKRPIVISGITFGGQFIDNGDGDIFFEDVCLGAVTLNGGNAWMRQYNPESKATKIINNGGNLWILGLKTEQAGTIVEMNGGSTEILGGFIYSQGAEKTTPMFVVRDGRMTATVGETTWNKRNFKTILDETRGSTKKELIYSKDIYWRNNNAAMLPLLLAAPNE